MKKNISAINKAEFREWQEHCKALFRKAKEEELARINETYKDVLDAQEAKKTALKRITDGFEAFCANKPDGRKGACDAETYAAFETAQAEMQRVADEFDAKWYKKLCLYVLEMDYLEKEHRRVMRLIKSPAVYRNSNQKFWLTKPDAENGGNQDA